MSVQSNIYVYLSLFDIQNSCSQWAAVPFAPVPLLCEQYPSIFKLFLNFPTSTNNGRFGIDLGSFGNGFSRKLPQDLTQTFNNGMHGKYGIHSKMNIIFVIIQILFNFDAARIAARN